MDERSDGYVVASGEAAQERGSSFDGDQKMPAGSEELGLRPGMDTDGSTGPSVGKQALAGRIISGGDGVGMQVRSPVVSYWCGQVFDGFYTEH